MSGLWTQERGGFVIPSINVRKLRTVIPIDHEPPLTLPFSDIPMGMQLDAFLRDPYTLYPLRFGKLADIDSGATGRIKERLAELPATVSLEARAVLLVDTLNNNWYKELGGRRGFENTYDFGHVAHLAKDVYGANGLYDAFNEWNTLLDKGVQVSWMDMHVRHLLLRNVDVQMLMSNKRNQPIAIDQITQTLMLHYAEPVGLPPGEAYKRLKERVMLSLAVLFSKDLLPVDKTPLMPQS